jgi:hypothetical protein
MQSAVRIAPILLSLQRRHGRDLLLSAVCGAVDSLSLVPQGGGEPTEFAALYRI